MERARRSGGHPDPDSYGGRGATTGMSVEDISSYSVYGDESVRECKNVRVSYRKCVCADVLRHHHVNGIHSSIIDDFSLMEINGEPVLANAEHCECCF